MTKIKQLSRVDGSYTRFFEYEHGLLVYSMSTEGYLDVYFHFWELDWEELQ